MKIKPYFHINRLAGEVKPKNSEHPTMSKQLRPNWAQDCLEKPLAYSLFTQGEAAFPMGLSAIEIHVLYRPFCSQSGTYYEIIHRP